jgi:hypothetical protein
MTTLIEKVNESIGASVKFSLYKPKKPVPKLPLMAYFARMPSVLDLSREGTEF